MLKTINKILSIFSYVMLMLLGLLMFLGFLIITIKIVIYTGPLLNKFKEWLLTQFDLNIDQIGMVKFLLAMPFFILSFIGLSIVLLTQRTANINKRLNSNDKKTQKLVEKVEVEKVGKLEKKE